MASQVTNYKCIACGGPLHFDSDTQKLKCDYCGSLYTNEEIEQLYKEKNEAALQANQELLDSFDILHFTDEEMAHLHAYSCPSCGAQMMCDETTAATSCPYCGNNTVVPSQVSGALKPDYIIPFKLNKDDAVNRLRSFYRGKPFIPNVFTTQNHIEEIKGIYVPFWLYDGTAKANMSYRATKSHSYATANENITVVEHYHVRRGGSVTFRHVPADASIKMPDEYMDALEPFYSDDLVEFKMSYMPGYIADRYDVSIEENASRVETRMTNTAYQKIKETAVGYTTLVPEVERLHLRKESVSYAFFPIWLLTTRWNGKSYMFAMNGQTGKMISDDLPVDNVKFFLWLIGLCLLFASIIFGLFYMF